jgi:hypothetical protein
MSDLEHHRLILVKPGAARTTTFLLGSVFVLNAGYWLDPD